MQQRDLLLRVVAMLTKMVRGTSYVSQNANMRSRASVTGCEQ